MQSCVESQIKAPLPLDLPPSLWDGCGMMIPHHWGHLEGPRQWPNLLQQSQYPNFHLVWAWRFSKHAVIASGELWVLVLFPQSNFPMSKTLQKVQMTCMAKVPALTSLGFGSLEKAPHTCFTDQATRNGQKKERGDIWYRPRHGNVTQLDVQATNWSLIQAYWLIPLIESRQEGHAPSS